MHIPCELHTFYLIIDQHHNWDVIILHSEEQAHNGLSYLILYPFTFDINKVHLIVFFALNHTSHLDTRYCFLICFCFPKQPIGNIAERFHALCLKDSGVLYEDPYIQV